MCDTCRVLQRNMILDYMVQCEVPFEVAVRLTRDSTTQNALFDDNGKSAVERVEDVIALNATLDEVAEALRPLVERPL